MKRYDVVMPIAEKDVDLIRFGLPYFMENLPIKQLIIIGNHKVLEKLEAYEIAQSVQFMEEDTILSLSAVKTEMKKISNNCEAAVQRSGWYLQQFLKILYAKQCKENYYLVWDADTIPLRHIHMMQHNIPIFHMKEEYYPSYFETMGKLIPGLRKLTKQSFISEHMLINTNVMCQMIEEIEGKKDNASMPFWKCVLNAVDKEMLSHSGFSEFETYGSYCFLRYPDLYQMKEYDSLRDGAKYFIPENFSKREANWIAKDYMAVSFEKSESLVPYYNLFHIKILQKLFHFRTLFHLEQWLKNNKAKGKRIVKSLIKRVKHE